MGITQQRLIDLNWAALELESALNELISRVKHSLELDPHNPHLQALATTTLSHLIPDSNRVTAIIAREAENIRLTRNKNKRRRELHGPRENPFDRTILDLPESAIEARGRLILEKLQSGELDPENPKNTNQEQP